MVDVSCTYETPFTLRLSAAGQRNDPRYRRVRTTDASMNVNDGHNKAAAYCRIRGSTLISDFHAVVPVANPFIPGVLQIAVLPSVVKYDMPHWLDEYCGDSE